MADIAPLTPLRYDLARFAQTGGSLGRVVAPPYDVIDAADRAETLTEFATADGVEHALAKVKDADAIRAIALGVAKSSLLIADGHHRYETALRYAEESNAPPDAEPRFFMTFLANGDDPDLV